jgi:hypothetical protein
MEQTKHALVRESAASGPIVSLHLFNAGGFAGRSTSKRSDSSRHSLVGAV